MNVNEKPKKVEIVFFTGTGGTRRVANYFITGFTELGLSVYSHEINSRNSYTHTNADMLIILYPVYALNAPRPVYDFVENLPKASHLPTVIISVSAGGEVMLNAASRLHCIGRLEKKGYHVVYESMIVMPSNFLTATPDALAVRLLHILPKKVDYIINELLHGVSRRTHPKLLSRLLSFIGEMEKSRLGDQLFGRLIRANNNCNGCHLCTKNCPTGNIQIINKRPKFGGKCTLCMRCFYGCPKKALKPRIIGFVVLKQGYKLEEFGRKPYSKDTRDLKDMAKDPAYRGIIKYLCQDKDSLI